MMTLAPLPGTPEDFWANRNERLRDYYENDWGRPKYDDNVVFELLTLEIFSAGLSWNLALKRREALREAFVNYDLDALATFGDADVDRLLTNPAIIRNRRKIEAVLANAKATLALTPEFTGLAEYVWSFTEGEQLVRAPRTPEEIPTQDDLSRHVAEEMKKRGFRFVGPVIVYNYLQACGVIDDHLVVMPLQ